MLIALIISYTPSLIGSLRCQQRTTRTDQHYGRLNTNNFHQTLAHNKKYGVIMLPFILLC